MRLTVKRLMIAVAASAAVIAFGAGSQTDQLSCHLCHNLKRVDSRLIFGFPFALGEREATEFPIAPGHAHSWSRFSRYRRIFGQKSIGCRMSIYIDGSTAPDGRR